MTDFFERLEQAAQALGARLEHAPPTDANAVLADLDRLTALHRASELVARFGPELTKAALLAGVPRDQLVGRPYHETQVRRLAREAGAPRLPVGRPSLRVKKTPTGEVE